MANQCTSSKTIGKAVTAATQYINCDVINAEVKRNASCGGDHGVSYSLKELVALDRSSWSLKSVCDCLLYNTSG